MDIAVGKLCVEVSLLQTRMSHGMCSRRWKRIGSKIRSEKETRVANTALSTHYGDWEGWKGKTWYARSLLKIRRCGGFCLRSVPHCRPLMWGQCLKKWWHLGWCMLCLVSRRWHSLSKKSDRAQVVLALLNFLVSLSSSSLISSCGLPLRGEIGDIFSEVIGVTDYTQF